MKTEVLRREDQAAAAFDDMRERAKTVVFQFEKPIRVIERIGAASGNNKLNWRESLHRLIVDGCRGVVQTSTATRL